MTNEPDKPISRADGDMAALRALPSVDRVLAHESLAGALAELPRAVVLAAVRDELAETRSRLAAGAVNGRAADVAAIAARSSARALETVTASLGPVINATGVIIHTNLGRAPLSRAALEAMREVAAYSNLEFDLASGERGSRYSHAAAIISRVTGAEDALVVNNNAAALVLALSALASGCEVVLSRGQAVEIGGGFRIPDVMRQSGARLVEVGTTNRTYVRDFEAAIGDATALLMRVHSSNFRIVGFTTSPSLDELATLAHARGLLLVDDIGSGALLDTSRFGLALEPTVQESLRAGADLVLFSGDKLLGGPQAGVIAGKGEIVARLKAHPLARALRVDKFTLAALEATFLHYLKEEAEREVPVWRMIAATPESLHKRADAMVSALNKDGVKCAVIEGRSAIGGGSLPGETLPAWLVAISPASGEAGELAGRLRARPLPIVGRVEEGRLLLDLRTVPEEQDGALRESVTSEWLAAKA